MTPAPHTAAPEAVPAGFTDAVALRTAGAAATWR